MADASPVTINATLTGLKFFFDITLGRGELMAKMQPVRVPRILPVVLSRDEVARMIAAAPNLKSQTALSIAYGTRLRASEVIALKVGHIDIERMMLRVEQGEVLSNGTLTAAVSLKWHAPEFYRHPLRPGPKGTLSDSA